MKKTVATFGLCFALSACFMQTNLDRAAETRAEHIQANRAEHGCQFSDDHAEYRNCLLNTYYKSKPKTYVTARDEKGNALAIIRNDATTSYDEKTGAYKTERVIVIETEEKLVPVPENVAITEQEILDPIIAETSAETVAPLKEEVKEDKDAQKIEIEVKEEKKESADKDATEPKKDTWWDRYQKDRKPVKKIKCPCEDPNDPCPQCVDK